MTSQIYYSVDGSCYYISLLDGKCRPRYFVSVEKIPGTMTDEMRQMHGFGPGYVEIKTEKETYCRRIWGFSFWDFHTYKPKKISKKDELFLDYACIHAGAGYSEWEKFIKNLFLKIY